MKEKFVMAVITLSLVLMASSAWAMSPRIGGTLNTPGVQKTLTLPAAAANAHVISLGSAVDPTSGKIVDGFAIVHYAKGGNGGGKGKPGGGGGKPNSCYALMAKGAKWKTVEPWLINPENNGGLPWDSGYPSNNTVPTESFAYWNMTFNIDKWEDAADGVIDGIGVDILGDGTETFATLVADMDAPDGLNEVYFADISQPGAIGVTIVWGIFGGPPQGRELVEWDQVYDDFDYDWSTFGEAGKMDFENIATHELGHSIGLSDLYDVACAEETMYGYADYGETKKQTLESGDIEGVSKLY